MEGIKLSKLNKIIEPDNDIMLTEDDINAVIALKTGIPSSKISAHDTEKLSKLKMVLSERIIGHTCAIERITNALYRSKIGLRDAARPIASFLFLGPTGTGKTELSKVIAECLFDSEEKLIRVDMSEYMEKQSVSKIIGAPPGYAGYDAPDNNLCEKVRRNPYSLILFDEIEKAESDVLNILLQILDYGFITDSLMRRISFRNCIIIMTSNIGAEKFYNQALGFSESSPAKKENNALEAIKEYFSPEFLNRIDEIVVFDPLEKESLLKISKLILNDLKKRSNNIGIDLDFTENVAEAIASAEGSYRYGVRRIKRKAVELIENKIADMYINSEISEGDSLKLDIEGNELLITRKVTV